MEYQFYPTPLWLAKKVRKKFTLPITRLLEPSAGKGDLLRNEDGFWIGKSRVDVIEIDPDNQATLRGYGFKVVGHDFLDFKGGAMYSHVILNPPFQYGVEHVLHAWDLLYDGEIAAIINAKTLKNPFTSKRRQLLQLIEDHGSVEYLEAAFNTGDEKRSASVDIALVYLRKNGSVINLISGLDVEKPVDICIDNGTEIAIRGLSIPGMVSAFNLAVEAHREASLAGAKAAKLASHLEQSISNPTVFTDESGGVLDPLSCISFSEVREMLIENFNQGHEKLKERAWSSVMRSTEIVSRLTSKAQKALEADFENIKQLEFTVKNIYGFLEGVISAQSEMTAAMLCEVFDRISKYHPKNRSYYRGWKSNARHRVFGFKIQMTRFVLPLGHESYSSGINYYDARWIEDIDKVFSYLDSKDYVRSQSEIRGVLWAFRHCFAELVSGNRVETDYFDVRYYPGTNTVHFFPRRKDLIERLNRYVGIQRAWIPESFDVASSAFWEQYERADSITRGMKQRVKSENRYAHLAEQDRLGRLSDSPYDVSEYERISTELDSSHRASSLKIGISVDLISSGEGRAALTNFAA